MTDSSVPSVSVIVPVKDGARYLAEVLDAVARQRYDGEVEMLVIDSGSRDGSLEIARVAGARVIEIDPAEFGHGKTRNLGAREARGECLVFLTQDATPADDGWLSALVAPLDAERRIGLSFGPHLPRRDTSPMLARELEEFFRSFASTGKTRIDESVDPTEPASGFFSNVNSCVLRTCWEEIGFREIDYSEDQAFARDALARGWKKAYVPYAAVLHAHDYPFKQFMQRYFDEYRGLRESAGHVEPLRPSSAASAARAQLRKDLAYMSERGWSAPRRAVWGIRSARHHAGRALFSRLGSRSDRLPAWLVRRISLEGRAQARDEQRFARRQAIRGAGYDYIRRYRHSDRAPLSTPSPRDGNGRLHLAWLVPPFRRGSGGHMTIFNIVRELEAQGHSSSVWVCESGDGTALRPAAVLQREVVEHFAPLGAGVFRGLDDWQGADVAFATGWQTAYPLAALGDCKLKAYLVQDYEPDFYPVSAPRMWAEETYRMGFPCIAASPWLRDVLRERFGLKAEAFELGVDHETYRPVETPREPGMVLFYARKPTPRRATELGLLALAELAERRPGVRIVLFGDVKPPPAPFDYEFAGVLDEESLARLYNTATLGLVLSFTNYSRIPKEMMACGLPVVDGDHPSVTSVFGASGNRIELAEPDPIRIAERLAALLDDPERRSRLAAAARKFVEPMTWRAAAEQIAEHAQGWLAERWVEAAGASGTQSRSASVDFERR
jgi:glycosyltransferase involved in cell wall biosynthesis